MKTETVARCRFASALAALLFSAALSAAPLTETTAVHTRPDATAPAISYLKAGTEPTPAPGSVADTPAGWMAIELPGPFTGYVENKDLTKSLDVKAGAPIRLAPEPDAGVLTTGMEGDKTSITGLHGRWTQIRLEKSLIGYIHVGGTPDHVPPIATTPAGSANPPPAPAPAPAPTAQAGRAAPAAQPGDSAAALPRQFAGTFVSTRRPFAPRRPYDYALNDSSGERYAYLDTSRLLITEQLANYVNRSVVIFGTARTTEGGKELVIEVESLQLP